MRKITFKNCCIFTLFILGCASAKPFEYHPDTEIPEGPGLFTKEAGALVIYDSGKQKDTNTDKRPCQPMPNDDSNATVMSKGAEDAFDESSPQNDTVTYQQFEKWRQEQKEFQEFREWKRSKQNTEAYQEFLEWKRWKAYKAWQQTQQQKE